MTCMLMVSKTVSNGLKDGYNNPKHLKNHWKELQRLGSELRPTDIFTPLVELRPVYFKSPSVRAFLALLEKCSVWDLNPGHCLERAI